MEITTQDILKLADLARLELTPDEVASLTTQLPKIVDYVSHLQAIDATIVPEVTTPTENLRADIAVPATNTEAILAQAPERAERLWRVDAVFS